MKEVYRSGRNKIMKLWSFLFLLREQKLSNIPKLTTAYERLKFVICEVEKVITIILPYLSQL